MSTDYSKPPIPPAKIRRPTAKPIEEQPTVVAPATTFVDYKLAKFYTHPDGYHVCVYCGDPADSVDHVPPSSRVSDYQALGLEKEEYLLVKACRSCNKLLSDSLQDSIISRIDELKRRLKKRKAYWTADDWSEEDLEELGPNLRSLIGASVNKQCNQKRRYEYKGGYKLFLH